MGSCFPGAVHSLRGYATLGIHEGQSNNNGLSQLQVEPMDRKKWVFLNILWSPSKFLYEQK